MSIKPLSNQPHIKVYLKYFGYGEQDFIPCEMCKERAVDVHHIRPKSLGGTDEIENLIGLCRRCHNLAHRKYLVEHDLLLVHKRFMSMPTTGVMGKKL